MENNEVLENEEVKDLAVAEESSNVLMNFESKKETETVRHIYTNIKDKKKLFNLGQHVDNLLNDCEGDLIRVKEVLIKVYEKPMKEPLVDEETGEVIKDLEYSMSCVLVDDNNVSYATGSKMFSISLMNYFRDFDPAFEDLKNGLEIKITKNKMAGSNNKALGFELI